MDQMNMNINLSPIFTQSLRSFSMEQPAFAAGLPPQSQTYHSLSFPQLNSSVTPPPPVQLDSFVRHLSSFPKPMTSLEAPLPGVRELLNQTTGSPILAASPQLPSLPPVEPVSPIATSPSPPPVYHHSPFLKQQQAAQFLESKPQLPQTPPGGAQQPTFSTGPSHVYHIVTFPNPQQPPKQTEADLAARKRKRWNPEDMERAIFHVEKKNMSARAAAMMCNVPRSTLWDRLCQRSSYQGRSQKAKRRRQSLS